MTQIVFEIDINRGFRCWYISQIYMGPTNPGLGRIVPNVDDVVFDWSAGIYRVISVDAVTNLSVLVLMFPIEALVQGGLSPSNDFYKWQPSIQEVAYLNTAVTPYQMALDAKYFIVGIETSSVVLFRGTDTSSTGTVISAVYDSLNNYIGNTVKVYPIDPTNLAITRPNAFNCSTALNDGEIVTLVGYTASNTPSMEHPFLVKNSSAIQPINNAVSTLVDVQLVSRLLDSTVSNQINVPANIPIQSSDYSANLIYADGTTKAISIDNVKCKLQGTVALNTAVVGVYGTLVLTYYPANNEPYINGSNPSIASLSHIYNVNVMPNTLNSGFKVYVIPNYNTDYNSYQLSFYLTTLDYSTVTLLNPSQYTLSEIGGNPINYSSSGRMQSLEIQVPITSSMANGFSGYTFVQAFGIQFNKPAQNPWIIDYLNTNNNMYGSGIYFNLVAQNSAYVIDMSMGLTSVTTWLSSLFAPLYPIYNTALTTTAPTPTHISLSYNGYTTSPILLSSNWNVVVTTALFNTSTVFTFNDSSNLTISWLTATGQTDVFSTIALSSVILLMSN